MYSERTCILDTQCFHQHVGSKNEADGKQKLDCMNVYQNIYQCRFILCIHVYCIRVYTNSFIFPNPPRLLLQKDSCDGVMPTELRKKRRHSFASRPSHHDLHLQGPEEIGRTGVVRSIDVRAGGSEVYLSQIHGLSRRCDSVNHARLLHGAPIPRVAKLWETGPETTCVWVGNAAFAAATFRTYARWNPGGVAEVLATALLTAAVAATGELVVDIVVEMATCEANLAEIAYSRLERLRHCAGRRCLGIRI